MAIRVIQDKGGENRFDERRIQLRANEARLSQETKALYSEVAFLKGLLTQNGIAVPDRSRVGLAQQEEGANVEIEKRIALTVGQEENKKKNRRKQIYVQQVSQQSLPGSAQLISPPLSGSALSGYTSTTGSPGGSAICMGNMDPEIVGMDFVLTYGRPVVFTHCAFTKLLRIVSSLLVYHISMWLRPTLAALTQILLLRPATP
ncbi:hypothetical protein J4E83_001022 [Alternaria metachromatica]|uniref:uncharacterized protein n=1 Tax=Alternaria metachromatica TaxID=283354 RepID=UPI0020C4E097|nr:uncharacterized protein J4E83_001022 [Alternaria metachromatica]KAI4636068.1 hypothetical protein J4E83_001022 [Alternaria metachromatica]